MPRKKPTLKATVPNATSQPPTYAQMQQAYLKASLGAKQKPVIVVKARQQGKAAAQQAAITQALLNQILPNLIDDNFFRSHGLDDDTDYIAPHEPGQLCEHNPYCEECYA